MSLTDYNYHISVLNLKELRRTFDLVTIGTYVDWDGRRVYHLDLSKRTARAGMVRPMARYVGHDLPWTLQKATQGQCRWSHRTV